jgi:hypothetical protein
MVTISDLPRTGETLPRTCSCLEQDLKTAQEFLVSLTVGQVTRSKTPGSPKPASGAVPLILRAQLFSELVQRQSPAATVANGDTGKWRVALRTHSVSAVMIGRPIAAYM